MRRRSYTRAKCVGCEWTGTVRCDALADGLVCPHCDGPLRDDRSRRRSMGRAAARFLDGTQPLWLIVGVAYGSTFGQRAAIGFLLTAAFCLTMRRIATR